MGTRLGRKGVAPLLKVVGGKRQVPAPEPKIPVVQDRLVAEEDLLAEPQSTSDEDEEDGAGKTAESPGEEKSAASNGSGALKNTTWAKAQAQGRHSGYGRRMGLVFKDESVYARREEPPSKRRKVNESTPVDEADVSFDSWSQSQPTRPSQTYGKQTGNLHTAGEPRSSGAASKRGGAKNSKPRKEEVLSSTPKAAFVLPAVLDDDDNGSNKADFKHPDKAPESRSRLARFQMSDEIAIGTQSPSQGNQHDSDSSLSDHDLLKELDLEEELSIPSSNPEGAGGQSSTEAHCPLCGVAIPAQLLQAFRSLPKSHQRAWKAKVAFCNSHKLDDATARYDASKYPAIDWSVLESRLQQHRYVIEALITGERPSFYRRQLEEHIATRRISAGALRDPSKAGAELPLPGYYGPRGAQRMQDWVMSSMGLALRRLGQTGDALMAAIGVSAFVQAIAVPEAAVRLIMEDIQVDEEKAREVLIESSDVGARVNPEEEESVEGSDEEDLANGEGREKEREKDTTSKRQRRKKRRSKKKSSKERSTGEQKDKRDAIALSP